MSQQYQKQKEKWKQQGKREMIEEINKLLRSSLWLEAPMSLEKKLKKIADKIGGKDGKN